MSEWEVKVDNKSFDRAGITKDPQEAICEYIWNGFEAGATSVDVTITDEDTFTVHEVIINDNGHGIIYDTLEDTFGGFLSTQKINANIRIKSDSNKGKGRFSYMSFAGNATWTTVYDDGTKKQKYSIDITSIDKAKFSTSERIILDQDAPCGTTVSIPINDAITLGALSYKSMSHKLLEQFAWYLCLNADKNVKLSYCSNNIDYNEYINGELGRNSSVIIDEHNFDINIIVWKNRVDNSSKIYYLSESGNIVDAENTTFNKNSANFYHAVFVKSSYFDSIPVLKDAEDNSLIEYSTGQRKIMRELKTHIRRMVEDILHDFLVVRADSYLKDMRDKKNYPYFSDDAYGQARSKDFETVTKELYCIEPKIFFKLKDKQVKSLFGFLSLLLDSNERENIIHVIEEINSLTTEQRSRFSGILRRSHLATIIDLVGIVQTRYEIVRQLEDIIFDSSQFANERDHIQKVIENQYWLFGDQYYLATADVSLEKSLNQYEKILDVSEDDKTLHMSPDEQRKRMDIFLYAGRMTETEKMECLVLELKAPSIPLSLKVYNQIVTYANIIRKEPRFNSQNKIWRFYAICASVEDDIKTKYNNFKDRGKPGLVDIIDNFEIYALSWDDVFTNFDLRHKFLLDKLKQEYYASSEDASDPLVSRKMVDEKVDSIIKINAR